MVAKCFGALDPRDSHVYPDVLRQQEQESCHRARRRMNKRQLRIDAAVRQLVALHATMPGADGLGSGVEDSAMPLRQLINEQLDDIPPAAMQIALHRTSISADEFVACDDAAYIIVTTRDFQNQELNVGGLSFRVSVRPVGGGDISVSDIPAGIAEYVGQGVYRYGFTITQEHAKASHEHATRQRAALAGDPDGWVDVDQLTLTGGNGAAAATADGNPTGESQEIMYEATVTYHGVPLSDKPSRFSVRLSRTYDCLFPGRAFAPGILHKIGTLGNSKKWVNPCEAKLVRVERTPANGRRGKDRDIVAPSFKPGLLSSSDCCTGETDRTGMELPMVTVDLGMGRMAMPTHYCLRSGSRAPFATEIVLDGLGGVDAEAFNGTYAIAASVINGHPSYTRAGKVIWFYDDYWMVTDQSDCQAWDRMPYEKKWQAGVLYSEQRKCLSPGSVSSWRIETPKGLVESPVSVRGNNQRLTVTRHEDIFETKHTSEGKAYQSKTGVRFHHSGGSYVTRRDELLPVLSTRNARARVTRTAPMSWRLESSADNFDWVVLANHQDEAVLTRGSWAAAHWEITRQMTGTVKGHRYFRIVQTRLPEQWPNKLYCAGFELYGRLSDLTKVDAYKRDQCLIC